MTPARSVAASVVALGFASSLTASLPAAAAPAPCERTENYAAQSGAELLRIERLEVRTAGAATERPEIPEGKTEENGTDDATDRILRQQASPLDPTDTTGEDSDTLSEGIGMFGEAVLDAVVPGGTAALTDPDAGVLSKVPPSVRNARPAEIIDRAASSLGAAGTGNGRAAGTSAANGTGHETANGTGQETANGTGQESANGTGHEATAGGTVPRQGSSAGNKSFGNSAEDEGPNRGRDGAKTAVVRGVGLGESRAALVSTTRIKSAAIARILEGAADSKPAWTKPVLQQAPPSHPRATTRTTPSGVLGPLRVGAGEVSAHARWESAMTCDGTAGEASRSAATMNGLSLLGNGSAALVHVPEQSGSLTTTALDRRGDSAQTVASATVKAGQIELAGGKVRVRMVRPPSLVTTMSVRGGQVHYEPARIEVSGPGIDTKRLDAVGEHVDVTLSPDRHAAEASTLGLDKPGLDKLGPGSPLPLPVIPGLPQVTTPGVESAPVAGAGTRLRISLGGVRQAQKGNAIAARATAIRVSVTRTAAPTGRGRSGYQGRTGTIALDLGVGLVEAASVAPAPAQVGGTSGAAGGLPITGPKAAGLAVGGLALVGAGIAAVALSARRRRTRS